MPRGLLNEYVERFVASGLSDAFYTDDGDPNAHKGSCITLQNLVPDRHTRGVFAPRPGYTSGFDASTAPGITVTAPGKVTFAIAPAVGAAITWTDNNTPTPQNMGTGDGSTVTFAFMKGGNPYQPVNAQVFINDWQGNQLQYTSARTELSPNNVSTSGYGGLSGFASLNVGATSGPDGGACVYALESNANNPYSLNTAVISITTQVGDFYAFVLDMALSPGYTHNENKIRIDFPFGVVGASAFIDLAANTVVSTTGAVTANFVSTLPNGFSRFSFVSGPSTTMITGPSLQINFNNGSTFTGDGVTKFYIRADVKKTQTVSGWIKNTTSGSLSVTDYQLVNTSVNTQIGDISALYVLGSRVYGMSLGNNVGTYFDAPFCYDFSTASFVTISGITTGNVPKSSGYPNGSGSGGVTASDWTPPQMALVGSKIIVTHYGFAGTGNYIGWIDISTPSAPAWNAGNLGGAGGLSFTVPPVAVVQFNGRAYYAVGGTVTSNNVIFSDSLAGTNCTAATQVLTIGDNQPITGFGSQPYNSTTQGGIVQSILAFKKNQIGQITGDPVTTNLLVNVIATGMGCGSPATIASTPLGVMFMAQDGIRYVNATGQVSNPLVSVRNPFANAVALTSIAFPTTACAAYNSNLYRISLYTTDIIGNVYGQEWVYDFEYGWHGPHIYGASPNQIRPSIIAAYGPSFIMATRTYLPSNAGTNSSTAVISNLIPGPADAFVEGGSTTNWTMLSCAQDVEYPMLVKTLEEATISYNPGNASGSISVSAIPTQVSTTPGTPPNAMPTLSATLSYTPSGALWGTAIWGQFNWGGGAQTNMDETTIPCPDVMAYKNLQWQVTGTSALNQRLGPISSRGTIRGFTNMDVA